MALHTFEQHCFTESTWCTKCKTFLWGLPPFPQGDRCRLCAEARCTSCAKTGGLCDPDMAKASGVKETHTNAINDEVMTASNRKQCQLTAFKDMLHRLEGDMASGESAMKAAEEDAQAKAAVETAAAARLKIHRLSLEELQMDLSDRKTQQGDKERQQRQQVKRFEEELSLASQAEANAKSRHDGCKRVCSSAVETIRETVAAKADQNVKALADHAVAVETHAAESAAMVAKLDRLNARKENIQAAERHLDVEKYAKASVDSESSEAEQVRAKAEADATAADAAVVSHNTAAAGRNRAHEVEIRRAKDRAHDAVTLRDMQSRSLAVGGDRTSLYRGTATVAADATAKALAQETLLHEQTQASDAKVLHGLQDVAAKANESLTKRETIAVALAARVEEIDEALFQAGGKHAAALAAHNAAQQEYDNSRQRVEGPLAKSLAECTAKLEDATKALASEKKKGERELAPLRHSEAAEGGVVKKHQNEKVLLMKAVGEAQLAIVEAHEDTMEDGEASSGEKTPEQALEDDVRRLAIHYAEAEEKAQEADFDYHEVVERYQHVKTDLDRGAPDVWASFSMKQFSDGYSDERKASLTGQIEDLKKLMQDKEQSSLVLGAEATAAKRQLQASQAQQNDMPRRTAQPIQKLVCEELAILDERCQAHKQKETTIVQHQRRKMSEWTKEKELMSADIHRAQLQVAVAEKEARASEKLGKSIGK